MSMRTWLLACVIALGAVGNSCAATRERLSLHAGWLFDLGDVAPTPVKGHGMSYWRRSSCRRAAPAAAR